MKFVRGVSRILLLAMLVSLAAACTGCTAQGQVPTTVPTAETEPAMEVVTEPAVTETEPVTEPATEPETEPTEPETEPTEPIEWPERPGLHTLYAFVYDCKEEDFRLLHGREQAILRPASMTKMMTALVAVRYLNPEDVITAGPEVDMVLGPKSSQIDLHPGDVITFHDLMKGMLVPSGCDAAYTIAAAAGRVIAEDPELYYEDAVAVFVEEMNNVGKEMGLVNSSFGTPDGQHRSHHYICLVDYAKIGAACLEEEMIRDIVCQYEVEIELRGRMVKFTSTNPHLNPSSKYYIPECVGLKTGSSSVAAYNLIAAFWVEDRYILIGVLFTHNDKTRAVDVVNLFNTYGRFPESN